MSFSEGAWVRAHLMDLDQSLHVLHVINGLGTGGAERSLAQMLPLLSDRGIRSTIVCLNRRSEGVQDEVLRQDWDIRFLTEGGWARRTWALRRIVQQVEPDLLHTTLLEASLLGRIATIGTRVPVLTSLVNVSYEPERLGDPNVRAYRLRIAQTVDALSGRMRNRGFHAISTAVADSNTRRLRIPPEQIVVIPRARPASSFPDASRDQVRTETLRALNVPQTAFVILTIGRQEFQKGHRHLVNAFSRISHDFPQGWLLIAGRSGNASRDLDATIGASGAAERILRLGHRDDVDRLLATADVFAFPSIYEGLGGALLEAMSVGSAVVASDIPALREVAGEAILYASPTDEDALGAQLRRLMADPELRSGLRRSSKERFGTLATQSEVADSMSAWYRACASQGHRSD